ncbi:MAG: A-macroglobulin complement component, partial [Planctomycetes bacterium]|nr:A-macroglobulin complement component [Planctomycetota bacterium]
DGQEVWRGETTIDAKGNASVKFNLPEKIAIGEGSVVFVIEDGGTVESAAKTLPILLQKLDVAAYPEGGDLIAGLASKVYFQAKTPWGDPADFEGRIVEAGNEDNVVGRVKSFHEGRGQTTITPEAGKRYLLKISKPTGITVPVALPEVKAAGAVITECERSYDADAPLEFKIAATESKKIRVVAANFEKEIAAATLKVDANTPRTVMLTPPGSAEGVIRVTLYDEDETPLAERLVFRHPRKKLNIELSSDRDAYAPKDKVQVTLKTTDDKGQPVAGAIVGITVTDESVLEMVETRKQTGRLPALIYLESNVEKLEDAKLYLSDDPKAEAALDLLLGTQGWRRFAFERIDSFKNQYGDAAKRVLAFAEAPTPIRFAGLRGGGGGGGQGGAWGDPNAPVDEADGGRDDRNDDAEGAGEPAPGNAVPRAKLAEHKGEPRTAAKRKGEAQDEAKDAKPAKNDAPAPKPAEEPAEVEEAEKEVADRDMERLRRVRAEDARARRPAPMVAVREYAHQVAKGASKGLRTDFTETVYWNAGLVTNNEGKATFSFDLSDSITSFKVMADGFSLSGELGSADLLLTSREPFVVEPKLPLEVTAGDL